MSPRVKEPNAGADRPGGSGSWGRRSGGLGRSPPLSPPRKRREELPGGCGAWRERKRRRQLHNIWQWRGPPGPRGSRARGGRASATLPATPPLPDVHPAPPGPAPPPFLPAGTCPTPASSSVPVRRRSQDPAVPATPRGHAAPSPLASPCSDGLPGSRGAAWGERSVRVRKWGAFPSVAPWCPFPDQARASSSPGPSRAGQEMQDHPFPAGTSHPIPPAPNPSGCRVPGAGNCPLRGPGK